MSAVRVGSAWARAGVWGHTGVRIIVRHACARAPLALPPQPLIQFVVLPNSTNLDQVRGIQSFDDREPQQMNLCLCIVRAVGRPAAASAAAGGRALCVAVPNSAGRCGPARGRHAAVASRGAAFYAGLAGRPARQVLDFLPPLCTRARVCPCTHIHACTHSAQHWALRLAARLDSKGAGVGAHGQRDAAALACARLHRSCSFLPARPCAPRMYPGCGRPATDAHMHSSSACWVLMLLHRHASQHLAAAATWAQGECPQVKCWDDLNDEERKAAQELGYDSVLWNAEDKRRTGEPAVPCVGSGVSAVRRRCANVAHSAVPRGHRALVAYPSNTKLRILECSRKDSPAWLPKSAQLMLRPLML